MVQREQNIQTLLKHYDFTQEDETNLKSLKMVAKDNLESFLGEFYGFVFKFMHANYFIKDDEIYSFHKEKIKEWFLSLFCGNYDEEYFKNLNIISQKHTKIGLPSHYVNASFNFVRRFVRNLLMEKNLHSKIDSFEKILDMNLDYITANFQESEQLKSFRTIETLNYAIKNNTVTPFLQPIVDTKSKKIAKYESLMRIVDEKGEMLSPFYFLEIAKKVDRYNELSKMMVQNVFSFMRDRGVSYSINLSEDDILDEEMVALVFNHLKSSGNSGLVVFEMVESEGGGSELGAFCEMLHKYGAKIAIDDFGTGFSNYERVLSLKPDIIKIDGSLIKDIDTRSEHKEVVETIAKWAKKLDISIVAEYVKSKEVSDIVESLEIDYMQGFYYYEPKNMRGWVF